LRNGLAFIFFGDGIPIIYAGTEHEFLGGDEFDSFRQSMWPHFQKRSETFVFIKKSLTIRKSILGLVVEGDMEDCFVDENYYVFMKQIGDDKIIVGITKEESDGEEHSFTITGISEEESETFQDLYTGQSFVAVNGTLTIVFNVARDPVLLKNVH